MQPLGREIAPGAALLSPRGNVLEGDMPRFFRRFREGLFDEDDVRRRARELANFVGKARRAYGLAQPFAIGYSNGANIAAAVLLLHPKTLKGAIPLRAMAPLTEPPTPDLSGRPGAHPVRIERFYRLTVDRGETGGGARRGERARRTR